MQPPSSHAIPGTSRPFHAPCPPLVFSCLIFVPLPLFRIKHLGTRPPGALLPMPGHMCVPLACFRRADADCWPAMLSGRLCPSAVQCDCGVIRGGGGCGTGDASNATQLQDYVETEEGCVAVVVPPECLNATDCARGPDLSNFVLSFDFNYFRPTVDGCSQMVTRRGNRDEVSRVVSRCQQCLSVLLLGVGLGLDHSGGHLPLAPPVRSLLHGGAARCLGAGCLHARILDMRLRRGLRADV